MASLLSLVSPANATGLKTLWHNNYKTDYLASSVHYTSNTVIVVYRDQTKETLKLGKFGYCSGEQLDTELLSMEPNVLPDSIQACDDRLFYVTNESESHYTLVCTDLSLRQIWNYEFTDPIKANWVWVEVKDNLLVVNVDKGVMVFEHKTGRMLSKFESSYILGRIYAGCVLIKMDSLSLIDPHTGISLWDYKIPDSGMWCYGIQKGIAMLSTRPTENDPSTRAICLDANTGKEIFSMEYNTEIVELGISRNLLCIASKVSEWSHKLDAFGCENWIFQWSLSKLGDTPLISENSVFNVVCPCPGTQLLIKIDPITGKQNKDYEIFFHDFHNPRFFRKIKFQANRIIVADMGVDCYIDESF